MPEEAEMSSEDCIEVENANSGHSTFEAGDPKSVPCITQLFQEKCVLVTGATGFLGKVLVEKLLRSCPGIKEILVLIRPSERGSAEERLEQYRSHRIFKRLLEENPDALKKLKVLSGDITFVDMGLDESQLQKVLADVSFVFHCAANVRFEDEARKVLDINLVGVKNVLDMCKRCKELLALVHVSTAYAFCNRKEISERVYPELVSPGNVIEASKWMTEEQLRTTCSFYMNGRPALYPFSKAMAEIFLVESNHDLPAIIVRPSIVTASVREPYPGWIDNYNGPSGFIYVCGKGVIRTLLVNPEVNADWVPVDIVANTLIVSAHYIAVKSKCTSSKLSSWGKVPIVNCTCPENNAITWMKAINICLPLLIKYPSIKLIRKPGGTVTSSPAIYYCCLFVYHYIPAFFMDVVLCLIFKKPRMISLWNRLHRVMSYLDYYTTRSFTFPSPNMRRLVEQMEPEDQEVFPIDQSDLNWNIYIMNYVLGVRRYFSRESDDNLEKARTRMMWYNCGWCVMQVSAVLGICAMLRSLYRRGVFETSLSTSLSVLNYAARKLKVIAK